MLGGHLTVWNKDYTSGHGLPRAGTKNYPKTVGAKDKMIAEYRKQVEKGSF